MIPNRATNSLILKSNRLLGTSLVEIGLINLQQLEKANELFLKRLKENDPLEASLLKILIFELQYLDENDLIEKQLKQFSLPALHLSNYSIPEDHIINFSESECKATCTIPIDYVSDVQFICSAYYLNPFVRDFWKDKINAEIFWYVAPLSEIQEALQNNFLVKATPES